LKATKREPGATGPPYSWGTKIQRSGTPGSELNARLTTLLCKNVLVFLLKLKKWKPDGLIPRNREIWQDLLRKAVAQKGMFFQ
jgi:hypothetical protein